MMHAFDGNAKAAKLGCDQGYYFSVPASVARQEKLIQTVPLDRLLLETDSPILSPNREERNEPKKYRFELRGHRSHQRTRRGNGGQGDHRKRAKAIPETQGVPARVTLFARI